MRPSLFWFPKLMPFLKLGDTIYNLNYKIRKMSSFQAGLAKNWQYKLEVFQKYHEQFKDKARAIEKIYTDYNVYDFDFKKEVFEAMKEELN